LFEVADSKKHSFLSFYGSLEIEEIVIFHFVVRGVGHGMMYYQILYLLNYFGLWIFVLDLGSSFMVEMDNC
jgi:hypothetical protein